MLEKQSQDYEKFDSREFINVLVMMDLQLIEAGKRLQKAMQDEDVEAQL